MPTPAPPEEQYHPECREPLAELQRLAPAELLIAHALETDQRLLPGFITRCDNNYFDAQEAHNSHPLGLPSPMDDAMELYAACYGQNIPCGLIHPEDDLTRLKVRGVGAKRGLAMREFSLGVEGLERFTAAAAPRAVHECVFAVLALESQPIDPRL